jgi:hypothetical protein
MLKNMTSCEEHFFIPLSPARQIDKGLGLLYWRGYINTEISERTITRLKNT